MAIPASGAQTWKAVVGEATGSSVGVRLGTDVMVMDGGAVALRAGKVAGAAVGVGRGVGVGAQPARSSAAAKEIKRKRIRQPRGNFMEVIISIHPPVDQHPDQVKQQGKKGSRRYPETDFAKPCPA